MQNTGLRSEHLESVGPLNEKKGGNVSLTQLLQAAQFNRQGSADIVVTKKQSFFDGRRDREVR
jgi:hypothetical protein